MKEYFFDKDKVISDMLEYGYSSLPSIKHIVESNNVFEKYLFEKNDSTYVSNSPAHKELVEVLGLNIFVSELHSRLGGKYKRELKLDDQYLISRYVKPGQKSEGYRGHFDSHLITIVLPVNIPPIGQPNSSGELLILPKARRIPSSELENVAGKFLWKRFNSEDGFNNLLLKRNGLQFDFNDSKPLIFFGNTTFHGNRPLTSESEPRLSMLCHFFDPSPKISVGAMMRLLRNR